MELEIRNISHCFAALSVLQGITLRVSADEFVAVLGPSGCGKSTLLRLVGGMEIPSSGSIRVIASNGRRSDAHAAFVLQAPTLLPWRTVAGNVSLALEHVEASKQNRHRLVMQALARVGLADFADWYPKTLSGGMLQRTNIARALVAKPSMLLMDEPFASLDGLTREGLVADLSRLWQTTPFTCLYVTHSPSEAVRLAHRVVILTARPARIREIVPINLAIDKRSESHPTIAAARERIRELIRMPE